MALSFNFIEILGSGKLALSERPKLKEVKNLVPAGCDRVVTILAGKGEQAHKIGEAVVNNGMAWEWLKVSHATELSTEEKRHFKIVVDEIYQRILENESVLVHCSAGLHRTGMFAYAILRKGGCSKEEAMSKVREIRPETFEALESKYLNLAEELY